MPAYVDTSALVKRYVAEVGSAWVRRLLAHPAQYVIYTSALSQVEVISALQRRVREGSRRRPRPSGSRTASPSTLRSAIKWSPSPKPWWTKRVWAFRPIRCARPMRSTWRVP
jgi:predicted nucleic acid-binding protein